MGSYERTQTQMRDLHDKQTEYMVATRAIVLLMIAVLLGLLFGSVIIGFVFGVASIVWMLIRQFTHEANYIIDHPRG